MADSEIPVGIDLGTTFSAIAYLDKDGRPNTITNSEGELTTPSVVFFDSDTVIVGSEAAYAGENDVSRLARAAKRDMGGGKYRKAILNQSLPPEVVQAFVLKRLKNDATLRVGEFQKAVVTVPAYFNEPRRKATQDAGKLAGLEVIDIINEPTAAALSYGVQRGFLNEKGEALSRERVLVYDLGGGTFDVTLMEIEGGEFNALATAGDVYLGGIDWDQRIHDYARQQIESANDVKFESDPVLLEKLMNQSVRAKKSLTARSETTIRIDHEGKRYSVDINRKKFEELTQDLLERTRLTTDRLLRESNLKWTDLTRLLLVGGSTRMPMVLQMLEKESGLQLDRSLSPDEAVAHGAAIYAGILMNHGVMAGKGISVNNVSSHDLGVLGIDPKTRETRRRIVIPKNHTLPAHSAKKFQTARDGQSKIIVQIVEGGTDEGMGATRIGKCVIDKLPADIKKGTEVVVSFNYAASGRVEVVAAIPAHQLKANSTIDRAAGMTDIEISDWRTKVLSDTWSVDEALGKESAASPQPGKLKSPGSKPQRKPVSQPSAGKSPAGKKASVVKATPKKKPSETPLINPIVVAGADAKSVQDFEMSENSGIFVTGDEESKPEVGESMLDFLNDTGDDPQESSPGYSALDIFSEDDKRKPAVTESDLGDFRIDL